MLNSIQSLNRSMDTYGRAAGNLLRGAEALGSLGDPSLRGIAEAGNSASLNSDSREASPDPEADLIPATADLLTAKTGVRASLTLVRTEDEMLGTLLDITV